MTHKSAIPWDDSAIDGGERRQDSDEGEYSRWNHVLQRIFGIGVGDEGRAVDADAKEKRAGEKFAVGSFGWSTRSFLCSSRMYQPHSNEWE